MLLRFIHDVSCITMSFLFNAEYCFVTWIYRILFLHSPANGHQIFFQILAIINNDAMNIQVPVIVWIRVFSSLEYNSRYRWNCSVVQKTKTKGEKKPQTNKTAVAIH